jgi:flagellar assembly factor FliW
METFKTPFGDIQVDPDTVITFPSGVPGLADCKRYKLLHEDKLDPQVMWLQSLDDMSVCFNVIEAERLGLSYQVTLSDEECAEIDLQDTDEAKLLLVLSRKGEKPTDIVANTQAPFVLNLRSRKALQKTGVRADVVFRNV